MTTSTDTLSNVYLVRYGIVPEVARFINDSIELPARGTCVVVQTDRGLQLGTVLERLKPQIDSTKETVTEFRLVRAATQEDLASARDSQRDCEESFASWCARITQWNLNLELIDLERTLDTQKLILYVLCDRGPDSTKLALQAAAGGFGVVEVQPVASTGLVTLPQSSCGSGGGGCGCSH